MSRSHPVGVRPPHRTRQARPSRFVLVASAPRRRPSPHRTRQARPSRFVFPPCPRALRVDRPEARGCLPASRAEAARVHRVASGRSTRSARRLGDTEIGFEVGLRCFTHWRGMGNDRMERGREMIGLSYRSSTREGRACRGRTPSASVPPSDATSASLPFRTCRGRTPSASVPHIGRDKRVPPVSYFLRAPARSVLTGRRLGAAPWRPAPRRRGYIACRGCTRRKSSRRTYPFCYAMMHTSKR